MKLLILFFYICSKQQREKNFNVGIVEKIKTELDINNPYVKQFRTAANMLSTPRISSLKMILLANRESDGRTYNLPSAPEVAALVVGDEGVEIQVRDVVLESKDGDVQHINELHPSYLPLQYPLLFPFGEDGYRDDIRHNELTINSTNSRKRVSIREYLSYRIMYRPKEKSAILHAGKLLQQFIVDVYTMMESQRLLWYKTHQKELRADLYQGLADAVVRGETDAQYTGKRIVLPSSFTGGARYMMGNYQDAMAICRAIGYPDLFITFTCNSKWPEITRICEKLQIDPSNCPQLCTRVFYLKLHSLMKTIKSGKLFGKVRAGKTI